MRVVFAKEAPKGIRVADRFHLLQNLAETLCQVFGTHDQALTVIDEAYNLSSVTQTDGTVVVRVPRPSREQQALNSASKSRARRLAICQLVWDLHHRRLIDARIPKFEIWGVSKA
ncbi:MAG: hypothetical protein NHB32_30450 [Fischerella sp. CENA71]|nr:hypothetical protein [Fischerella sp. CENA71]